jgi:hypothetical protein
VSGVHEKLRRAWEARQLGRSLRGLPPEPTPGWLCTYTCQCGKSHLMFTGRECPCGEPFPHEFRA